jgi:hypothetical protein
MNPVPIFSRAAALTAVIYAVLGVAAAAIASRMLHLSYGRWVQVLAWLSIGTGAAVGLAMAASRRARAAATADPDADHDPYATSTSSNQE